MDRRVLSLAIPFTISIAPWCILIWPFFIHIPGWEPEGYALLATLIEMLSFILTGPITGFILSVLLRSGAMRFRRYTVLFLLISLPTLALAVFTGGISFVFIPQEGCNGDPCRIGMGVISIVIYVVYLAVMYRQAKAGPIHAAIAAITLIAISSALVIAKSPHGFL
jgi:hypothetical protein